MYLTRKQLAPIADAAAHAFARAFPEGTVFAAADLDAIFKGEGTFAMDTDAGTLRGSYSKPFQVNRTKWCTGFLHLRFDDPKAAAAHVGCNPFSGKWNHEVTTAHDQRRMSDQLRSIGARNFRRINGMFDHLPTLKETA